MPAFESIAKPTEFATWKLTSTLFSGLEDTETCVIEGPPGVRYAYGRTTKGFCFFISMTPAEELEFCQRYFEWRNKHTSRTHSFISAGLGTKPPSCDTPNTPKCVINIVGPGGGGCVINSIRAVLNREQAA